MDGRVTALVISLTLFATFTSLTIAVAIRGKLLLWNPSLKRMLLAAQAGPPPAAAAAEDGKAKAKVTPTVPGVIVGGSLLVLSWVAFIGTVVSCCMVCCRRKDVPETYHQLIPLPPPREQPKRRRHKRKVAKKRSRPIRVTPAVVRNLRVF